MIDAFLRFYRRAALLVRRRRAADDLADEMRLHVELRAAAHRRQGLDDGDAARAARRQFGNQLRLREESQDMWGFTAIERTVNDARYAVRQLIRRPGWTLTVLLTLALGLGANTSIFALVDAMLFRPAPGQRPEQLVWVSTMEGQSGHIRAMSYPGYADLRNRTTTMSGVLAYGGTSFSVGGERAERLYGNVASGNYFDVLGISAAIGRTFAAEEDTIPGAHPVAVVSNTLWRRRFNADPNVVGTSAVINGRPFTIIGVAPAGFVGVELGENAELWVPLAMQREAMPSVPDLLTDKGAGWLRVVGRLRDNATVEQADVEMRTLSKQAQLDAKPEDERLARVTPIRGGLDPGNRSELVPVFALISVVPALVLLVACFNVANVLMARNVGRRKEFAMRRAIGATRARLVSQLLVEAIVLALLASACGFVVSYALTALIVQFGEVPAEVASVIRPDAKVLAATSGLAVLTTLIFGLAPALTATRFELLPSLKDEGLTSTPGAGRRRLRGAFVVAQVAVSLALLITAGLFLKSMSKALEVHPGFESRAAATLSVDPALQGYSPERQQTFVTQVIDAASALPGVTAASVTSSLPLSGRMMGTDALAADTANRASATFASIAPHYFTAMGIDLIRGRDFSSADVAGAPPVVIINDRLARRLWPETDAIGKLMRPDDRGQPWREVVGIARDGKYAELTEQPRGMFYMPLAQQPASPITLVARTAVDAGELLRRMSAVAQRLDRDMPLFRVETLEGTIRQVVDKQRAAASLLGVFGAITLLLAAIGMYGVASHAVSLRTREIGIRMSLGARAADVLRMFARETLALAVIGVVIGLAVSAAASRLLASFLFGLGANDAMTFASAAAVIGLVAVMASYVPARRAARVDPLRALRHD
jgi:predicted permease